MNREEYPRPQFVRNNEWTNLNGKWKFAFDDDNIGRAQGWSNNLTNNVTDIIVPFVYESKLSGIESKEIHDIIWYQRSFEMGYANNAEEYILHCGAIDYFAEIYINGKFVGRHEGGDTSFEFNITNYLNEEVNQNIIIRAEDRTFDETIPRGKQSWTGKSDGIWYTNSVGIWQTVWIEKVPKRRISKLRLTPDLDNTSIKILADLSDLTLGDKLLYEIRFDDEIIARDQLEIQTTHIERSIELFQQHIFRTSFHNDGWTWTPENPNLFDIDLKIISNNQVVDSVSSYFGMRKISTENGMIMLNNKPYYQKLVLDQGYWPDSLLTAPSDRALREDIELAKKMGFNGCRKHQKIEDPRFLYWADKIGYLVWEEVASVPIYSSNSVNRLIDAWQAAIDRDYNHPSIIMWVPLNESWGVDRIHLDQQQQHFSEALYHLIHSLDNTRLVQSNDGWDNTTTDVMSIHNYNHGSTSESDQYKRFQETLSSTETLINNPSSQWDVFAKGFRYQGQPILLTEFGGIGYSPSDASGWGYTTARSSSEFLIDLKRLMNAISNSQGLWGYCYTQLADVEQEMNGLLTAERKPKAELDQIREIFDISHNTRLHKSALKY